MSISLTLLGSIGFVIAFVIIITGMLAMDVWCRMKYRERLENKHLEALKRAAKE